MFRVYSLAIFYVKFIEVVVPCLRLCSLVVKSMTLLVQKDEICLICGFLGDSNAVHLMLSLLSSMLTVVWGMCHSGIFCKSVILVSSSINIKGLDMNYQKYYFQI